MSASSLIIVSKLSLGFILDQFEIFIINHGTNNYIEGKKDIYSLQHGLGDQKKTTTCHGYADKIQNTAFKIETCITIYFGNILKNPNY